MWPDDVRRDGDTHGKLAGVPSRTSEREERARSREGVRQHSSEMGKIGSLVGIGGNPLDLAPLSDRWRLCWPETSGKAGECREANGPAYHTQA